MYDNIIKNDNNIIDRKLRYPKITNNYILGGFVEILSPVEKRYKVEFFTELGKLEYTSEIGSNMWCRTNKKYFEKYTCKVTDIETDIIIFNETYNADDKRVFVTLESKALGDTFAWIPYIDEFQKKHNCKLICSTFHNNLFKDQYKNINFVEPGTMVDNLYAMYKIGWFYDDKEGIRYDLNKEDFRLSPLQKTSSDILGLDFKEIKPLIKKPVNDILKKVGIGFHSTAQSKYWNNETGWQEVTDFLINFGYEVVIYSIESDGYMNNYFPNGSKINESGDLNKLIYDLSSCEFFIGISSGISWITWALGIPTVLISGFTESFNEPTQDIIRVGSPDGKCTGCANKYKLDVNDWNWCPINKGTYKQFECTKSITGGSVINILLSSKLIMLKKSL